MKAKPTVQVPMSSVSNKLREIIHAPISIPISQPPPPSVEPKLPEPHVPIRKYYGRKRDDQSSSDEHLSFEEDNEEAK